MKNILITLVLSSTLLFSFGQEHDSEEAKKHAHLFFTEIRYLNHVYFSKAESQRFSIIATILYAYDHKKLALNDIQLSPLIGYEYDHFSVINAQNRSLGQTYLYGIKLSKKVFNESMDLGIYGTGYHKFYYGKDDAGKILFSDTKDGYKVGVYIGPRFDFKSIQICPYLRTEHQFQENFEGNTISNLTLGIQTIF